MSRNMLAFALLCLLWGLAWAAAKLGPGVFPPLQLAAWRYLSAAVLLALFVRRDWASAFRGGRAARTIVSSLLAFTGTYGPLFWGMQHVSSGLAGLVNMALVPIFLFALAIVVREEKFERRHAFVLEVGCVGLTFLFWSRLQATDASAAGLCAIVAGTASSCVGITLSRPLLATVDAIALAAVQCGIGGISFLMMALALEPFSAATLAPLATLRGIGSVLFLAVMATIFGYTLYLILLRDWGTVRASLYAFVSPVIALAAGALLFGEVIGATEAVGAALLLSAAALALWIRRRVSPSQDATLSDGIHAGALPSSPQVIE